MDILLDLNIILDAHIYTREGHLTAKRCIQFIEQKKWNLWISASSADNLLYTLLNEGKRAGIKKDWVEIEFRKFMKKLKIFSATSDSVRKSLEYNDIEDYIIYTNFRRIAPKGVIISNDEGFKKLSDVISPNDFIEKYFPQQINSATDQPISMLDLREEYRFMIEDIDEAVLKNIADAKYILGPEVKTFEDKVTQYLGVKQCIGVSSGTDALVLALRALAIKTKCQEYFDRTDEIITTPFTFTATGDAILRAGATPVFVDIDPDTYNINPAKIKEYLRLNPSHVVGIIPVHLYGQSCQMDEIMEIAREYNLFVLEDVAQAFGGMWKGRKLGSIGAAGAFSFFPSKNLGGFGDGGMVSTNDDKLAELVRMLLKHGGKDKYNVDHIGYNARLDTLQAAILLAKFKYIDEFNKKRSMIAAAYDEGFKNNDKIIIPKSLKDSHHVHHQYTISINDRKRDTLQKYLKEKGIDSMVYYPMPLHKMKVFGNGLCKNPFGLHNSESLCQSVLSLPVEPLQSSEDTSYIIECVNGF